MQEAIMKICGEEVYDEVYRSFCNAVIYCADYRHWIWGFGFFYDKEGVFWTLNHINNESFV